MERTPGIKPCPAVGIEPGSKRGLYLCILYLSKIKVLAHP
jgi:hypothetical protein